MGATIWCPLSDGRRRKVTRTTVNFAGADTRPSNAYPSPQATPSPLRMAKPVQLFTCLGCGGFVTREGLLCLACRSGCPGFFPAKPRPPVAAELRSFVEPIAREPIARWWLV
jgi:hypothetical protein